MSDCPTSRSFVQNYRTTRLIIAEGFENINKPFYFFRLRIRWILFG